MFRTQLLSPVRGAFTPPPQRKCLMSMSSLPQLKHNEPPLCARPNAGCSGDRQMGLRPFLAVIPNLVFLEEEIFS